MVIALPALIVISILYALSIALVYHFNDTVGQRDSRFNVDNKKMWVYIAPIKAAIFIFLGIFRVLAKPFRSKEEKRRERLEKERRLLLEEQKFSDELDKIIYEKVEK